MEINNKNEQSKNTKASISNERSLAKKLLQAAIIINNEGYLKNKEDLCGKIIYKTLGEINRQLQHNNKTLITELLKVANTGRSLETLKNYINYAIPSLKARIHKNKIVISQEGKPDEYNSEEDIITYDLFKKIPIKHTSKPALEIIKKEIKQKHSEDWKAVLERYIRWPTTYAPDSFTRIFSEGWVESGVLRHHGYHVGIDGLDEISRKNRLDHIMSKEIDKKIFSKRYICQRMG